MPLPKNNTLFTIGNNVVSLKVLSKSDRNYIAKMRSPKETPEERKLPKTVPTSIFRICKNIDLRNPYLVVATVDFENWEVIASSEVVSRSTNATQKDLEIARQKEALREVLTLFFFDQSRKNGNIPINLALRPKVAFLKEAQKEAMALFAQNPDFEVQKGVEPAPKRKKAPSRTTHRPAPKKKSKPRKPRVQRDPAVIFSNVEIPPEKSSYLMVGLNEREIKSKQVRNDVKQLRKDGNRVDVYKICSDEGKNSPHILLTTSGSEKWTVRSVFPSNPKQDVIDTLQEVFTLFLCHHSQFNEGKPIDVSMKSMPGWLITEHNRALSVHQAKPDLTIIETLLNAEAGQKAMREIPSKDNGFPCAPKDAIDKVIEAVNAKREKSEIPEDTNEQPVEEFSDEQWTDIFAAHRRKVENNTPKEESEIDDSRTLDEVIKVATDKTARITGSEKPAVAQKSSQPKPDIAVEITPAIMMARRRLVAQNQVPGDVNWNNPDTHQRVLEEVERVRAARASTKLGQGQTSPAAEGCVTPSQTGSEVKGM